MNNFFANEAVSGVTTTKSAGFSGINKEMLMMMAMTGGMNSGEQSNGGFNPMMFMLMGDKSPKLGNNPMLAQFMPTEIQGAGMSFDGSIVLNNTAIKFVNGKATSTTTEGLQIDMPLYSVPTSADQVKVGDIVDINGEYIAVEAISEQNGTVEGITIGKDEVTERRLSSNLFGNKNIRKVFNPFGANGQIDPMMAMLLMA